MKSSITALISTLFVLVLFVSCKHVRNESLKREIFEAYLHGMNNRDFNQVKQSLADSIIITEMGYQVVENMDAFRRHFLWDSVFRPDYTLIDFHENDTATIGTVAKLDERIQFLQDSALVYQVSLAFEEEQIVGMSTIKYVKMDGRKWMNRLDSLTSWITTNHPELSGFAYDLTPKGAQNFLQAMSLFKSESGNESSSE
jgi:hypothetical protein